jgi:hypothetical protein
MGADSQQRRPRSDTNRGEELARQARAHRGPDNRQWELAQREREPRPYFCRNCGEERLGIYVPADWYTLTRAPDAVGDRSIRLGVYCSLACLEAYLPRLSGMEAVLANRRAAQGRGNGYRIRVPAPNPPT